MKTFYLFYVLITLDGESLHRANDVAYKSILECKVDQVKHQSNETMKFFVLVLHYTQPRQASEHHHHVASLRAGFFVPVIWVPQYSAPSREKSRKVSLHRLPHMAAYGVGWCYGT